MRIISVALLTLLVAFGFAFINEIRNCELIVSELYYSGFKKYVLADENGLYFDNEKLISYFEGKGYKLEWISDFSFCISFKKVFYYSKEYKFYLVNNDG